MHRGLEKGGGGESVSVTDCTYLLPASLIISIHGMYMRHVLSSKHKNTRRTWKRGAVHLVSHGGIT